MASLDRPDLKALKARWGRKDLQGRTERKDRRVTLARLAQPASKGHRGCQERLGRQV